MARKTSKSSDRMVKVDFSDIDRSGGSFHIPEGEYGLEIDSVERETSKNGNEMLVWMFKGKDGKAKGKTFWYYTTLTPESLWKLANLLEGLGLEVPEDEMDIDLAEMVGLSCTGVIADDEYEGKTRSKLVEVTAGEAEPAKNNGKTPSKKKITKLDPDEVKAMSEDELIDLNDEHELEVDLDAHKTPRRKVSAILEALEERDMIS